MTLQGKSYRIDAEEAHRIGLLTEIVPCRPIAGES